MSQRPGYHHGNLKQALTTAALDLLAEKGPASLTLRGTARRAGVSEAAPYRHFADKEALLASVAEQGFLALAECASAAMANAGSDPLERFRAHGRAYVQFAVAHPEHYRVMFGAEIPDKRAHPGLSAAADSSHGHLRQSIVDCQAAGQVREGDPEELAVAAWAVVHGLSSLWVDGQLTEIAGEGASAGPEALFELVASTLFEGVMRQV